eukprot:scaffold584_cov338-Pavlova_lutheri.AAC.35
MSNGRRRHACTRPCRFICFHGRSIHVHLAQMGVSAVLVVGQDHHLQHKGAHVAAWIRGERHGAPTLRFRHLHADHLPQVPRRVPDAHRHLQRRVALVASEIGVHRHALHRNAPGELGGHGVRLCAVALPVRVRASVSCTRHAVAGLGRRRAPHREGTQLASAARLEARSSAREDVRSSFRHARTNGWPCATPTSVSDCAFLPRGREGKPTPVTRPLPSFDRREATRARARGWTWTTRSERTRPSGGRCRERHVRWLATKRGAG